jgi:acyl dehydratase
VSDAPPPDLAGVVGESRRTVEGFLVERGKVAEFARAVGDDDPVYRSASAAAARGFPAIPAPPTFPRVSSFPRYRVDAFDLGFDPEYVLHGEQRYTYERPLYVGDELVGETTLTDAYEREGRRGGTMTFATFTTEYRTADGDLVLTESATSIETEGAADDGTDEGGANAGGDGDARANGGDATAAATADDLVGVPVESGIDPGVDAPDPTPLADLDPGDAGPAVTVGPFARQDFVRYAGASGDFNPIHYDEPYATGAGHPSVFGQGMLTAGVAAHAVADLVGLARLWSFGVRFRSQVWPGDTVTARAEVTESEDVPDDVPADALALAVTVTRDDGETVLSGTASAASDLRGGEGRP